MKETSQAFNAERYKQTQHDQWNEDSAAWYRWTPAIQNWFGPVTDLMLELAEIRPGHRVLDIASGAGEPALSAAARVSMKGYVLATDLSENMLMFAQKTASERSLRNFDTRVMDGENPDLPDNDFDAVLCRFGLMLLPDKNRALTEWHRVLKPRGHAVAAVFSAPERNDWAAIPISIIRKRAELPPPMPGQPGIFSMSGDRALENTFRQAGFQEVDTYPLTIPLRMPTTKEAILFARESFGTMNQIMLHLSQEDRNAVWDEVEEAMRVNEGPNGFEASCEALVGIGIK